jgi:ABC-type multidrug transport system ATPase subunit
MCTEVKHLELAVKEVFFKIKDKGKDKNILNGVSFSVKNGEILAILGPTGWSIYLLCVLLY